MRDIHQINLELRGSPFPGGMSSRNITLHSEIITDAATKITILISSYFNDEEGINLNDVQKNEQLDQRLDQAIEDLIRLRDHKQKYDELARALIDALSTQSKTCED